MAEFSLNPRPSTPPCINYEKDCLCHFDGGKGKMSSFTEKGWKSFQEAAALRNDCIAQKMVRLWEKGPIGQYHRSCFQRYTSKDHIQRILQTGLKRHNFLENSQSTSGNIADDAPPLKVTRPSRRVISGTDLSLCIICQTDKIDQNNRRKKEQLTSCETQSACDTLRHSACISQDKRLLLAIENEDMFAIEVKYHRTCYRDYTRMKVSKTNFEGKGDFDEGKEDIAEAKQPAYEHAFNSIANQVLVNVIQGLDCVKMSDLRDSYIQELKDHGIDAPNRKTQEKTCEQISS